MARMSAAIVSPIAKPPSLGPRWIDRRAEDHEDEEERRDRLEPDRLQQRRVGRDALAAEQRHLRRRPRE